MKEITKEAIIVVLLIVMMWLVLSNTCETYVNGTPMFEPQSSNTNPQWLNYYNDIDPVLINPADNTKKLAGLDLIFTKDPSVPEWYHIGKSDDGTQITVPDSFVQNNPSIYHVRG